MPEDTIIQRMSAQTADLRELLHEGRLGEDEGYDVAETLARTVDEFLSEREQERDPDIEVTVTMNDGSHATWWLNDNDWTAVERALGRQPDSHLI